MSYSLYIGAVLQNLDIIFGHIALHLAAIGFIGHYNIGIVTVCWVKPVLIPKGKNIFGDIIGRATRVDG